MDFVKKYFDEYDSAFIMRLKDVGIVGDLARQLLTETSSEIMSLIKKTRLEKSIVILSSDDPSQLLSAIDIDTMANRLCISRKLVITGLGAIAPVMSLVFKLRNNEIVAATASLAWDRTDRHCGSMNYLSALS